MHIVAARRFLSGVEWSSRATADSLGSLIIENFRSVTPRWARQLLLSFACLLSFLKKRRPERTIVDHRAQPRNKKAKVHPIDRFATPTFAVCKSMYCHGAARKHKRTHRLLFLTSGYQLSLRFFPTVFCMRNCEPAKLQNCQTANL